MGSYYHTKESVAEYIRLAEGFNGQELIKKLRKYLSDGSSVLEIGSGPGTDYDILNKEYEVVGSDNSDEFLKHLKSAFPDGSFRKLEASTLIIDKKFDAIYSNKVLHHLTNEELSQSVERQNELLNAKGVICHSFWKGEGSEVFKGLFVNYHLESTLQEFFKEHFEIILTHEYAEFEAGDSLLLIARKC